MDKINDIWKDNIQWIIEIYQAGWNQVALAAEFQNATNTTIRRILKRNNIEIRGNGIDQRKVKHNPFEDLNSPKVQYWLVAFLTDEGMEPTVYTTKLGLYSIDVCKQAKVRQMYFNMYKHAPEYFIADKYKRFGEIFGEIQR